jgi:divalent metal cation (Fe/Co/Zn/Cd) transporter
MPVIRAITDLRARNMGSLISVDLTAVVPTLTTVSETAILERKITEALKNARKEVSEVRVQFRPVDEDVVS